MQHSYLRRLANPVIAMGLLALAACSQQSSTPFDSAEDPGLALQAQHDANLKAIEVARAKSNAVYDQMVAAWNARNTGNRPMTTAGGDQFVPCAPLPFDGEAQIVGPAGGTFTFGPHQLMVPAGALSTYKSIAVIVNTDLKTKVTLLPHGTTFSVPVRLTLAYAHCEAAPTHRIAYIDELGQVIAWPTSADFPDLLKVEGWLDHFSDYAIAY